MNCHPTGCPEKPTEDCWENLLRLLQAQAADMRPEIRPEVVGSTLEVVVKAVDARRIRGGLWPYARKVARNIAADQYHLEAARSEIEISEFVGESVPALPDRFHLEEVAWGLVSYFMQPGRSQRARRFGHFLREVLWSLPEGLETWSPARLRSHILREVASLMRCKPESVTRTLYRVLEETGGRDLFEYWYMSGIQYRRWEAAS